MKMNKIVCLTGPSGVGKTSYAQRLQKEYNFFRPKVATTRLPRLDDEGDLEYLNENIFLSLVHNGAFVEYDKYLQYYYGTYLADLIKAVENPSFNGVVLDLTPVGCKMVRDKFSSAVIIGLVPDDITWLVRRLKERNTQTESEILERTSIITKYMENVESLDCFRVTAFYEESSWNLTFNEIVRFINLQS